MGLFQLTAQVALGLMTGERLFLSALALLPCLLAMPAGAWIGGKVAPQVFDRIILAILGALALRLFHGAWF